MKRASIRRWSFVGAVALIAAFFVVAANAQELRAAITGTLTDANAAVVQGVTVILKITDTNYTTTVNANAEVSFALPSLSRGTYNLTAWGDGVKTSSREASEIRVDARLTVDFKLEVGNTA